MTKVRHMLFIAISLSVLTRSGVTYCQESQNFRAYLGASGTLDTNGDPGWGIEGGLQLRPFYFGVEYGTYSYRPELVMIYDPSHDAILRPYPTSTEQFWGFHAGYIIDGAYYLGIVLLKSYESWNIPQNGKTYTSVTNSYLNIGPDFRYTGIDNGHMYVAFALTIRRGLKAGLGYMF